MKIPLIMNTSLHAYLEAMRQFPFLAKRSPQQYFRRPGKDFTRTRILHLERVVWLNITLLKCTPDQFFDWLDAGQFSPTKNALVQARQRFIMPAFLKTESDPILIKVFGVIPAQGHRKSYCIFPIFLIHSFVHFSPRENTSLVFRFF